MKWSRTEIDRLYPILEQVSSDLFPVDGKNILVLCSATGEVAIWLGEMMETGKITGLELDLESLELAQRSAREMGLEQVIEFKPAEMASLPVPDATYDALVSEFIVYPTSTPTQVGQAEMARVLKPGGRLALTDVIVTRPLPQEVREALQAIGLDYLCSATRADFHRWLGAAGLVNIEVIDLTPIVRGVWESRREADPYPAHQPGYAFLLDDHRFGLGRAIFYLYARGRKPMKPPGG